MSEYGVCNMIAYLLTIISNYKTRNVEDYAYSTDQKANSTYYIIVLLWMQCGDSMLQFS